MYLRLMHPNVESRDCQHCLKYMYNADGKVETKNGLPCLRNPGFLPDCQRACGCPKGTPEAPKSLSEKNRKALDYYYEAKATGLVHDDPIVRKTMSVIHATFEAVEEHRKRQFEADLVTATRIRNGR